MLDWVLDRSIVFSFDKTGFARHASEFDPADLAVDLRGRVALVTGANSGLGFAASARLAELGAEVIMVCRSAQRAEAAASALRSRVSGARVSCLTLDVSDPAAAGRFSELAPETVDILVNNAGVLPNERILTPCGIELTWATNLVGPFALTRGLLGALGRSPDPRVIAVSSGGMYPVALDLEDWQWKARRFDGTRAYAMTKRGQVVLNELWAAAQPNITFSAMHPGWADTPAVESSLPRFHRLTRRILRTPAQGADTMVWLAAAERQRGQSGGFWFDRRPAPTHVLPSTRTGDRHGAALWALCEELARGK